MADPYYQNLERTLRDMRFHVHDTFERASDPRAQIIARQLEQAENMAQSQHNLRGIEDRIKSAQNLLKQVEHAPEHDRVMNVSHAEAHFHNLEHLRMDIRRQPHY